MDRAYLSTIRTQDDLKSRLFIRCSLTDMFYGQFISVRLLCTNELNVFSIYADPICRTSIKSGICIFPCILRLVCLFYWSKTFILVDYQHRITCAHKMIHSVYCKVLKSTTQRFLFFVNTYSSLIDTSFEVVELCSASQSFYCTI